MRIKSFLSILCGIIIISQNPTNAQDTSKPIKIKSIEVEGATIFPSAVLTNLIDSKIDTYQDFEDLNQLTNIITNFYVKQGYITSGAFLSQQDISNGVVRVQILEGRLEALEIEGLTGLKEDYIFYHFETLMGEVFSLPRLEIALDRLRADTAIERVSARLIPGNSKTNSILLLDIEESKLIESRFTFNNYASAAIGELQGVVFLSHRNLLGLRDRVKGQFNFTEGFLSYNLEYSLPLNRYGTSIIFGYRNGESRIIEEPFDDVDIRAEADILSLRLNQTIARSLKTQSNLSLSFERSEVETFVLDTPYSIGSGPIDGLSQLSVLRLEGDFLRRSSQNIFFLRTQLSLGVDLLEVTVNQTEPDGLFLSWFGQFEWVTTLNQDRSILLITRLASQLTPDSLLPFEKFSLGGVNKVRGYRRSRAIGDNAILAGVELSFSLFDDPTGVGKFNLTPFVDFARVWDNDSDLAQSLFSLGLGFDWRFREQLALNFDFAIPLTDVQDLGDSLSDRGIFFSLEFSP